MSWSSYSINLLLFPSPRGPLAWVIKRDVITRHGGPLQLQPPRNSPSIRQQSRQSEGEEKKKDGRQEREGELEKWGIKERRRYGPGRREIRRREQKGDRSIREKNKGDRKWKESNSGWTGVDLSWPDIRRTSRP